MENLKEIYSCSYKEVIIILGCLSDEDWNKIPKERKDFYFENMKKDYDFKFDYTKSLDNQKILPTTKAILANIFKNYLATSEEKQEIYIKEQEEYNIIEEEKRKKYNPDDIFKKENKNESLKNNNDLPIKIKLNWFQKIVIKIKEILKIN